MTTCTHKPRPRTFVTSTWIRVATLCIPLSFASLRAACAQAETLGESAKKVLAALEKRKSAEGEETCKFPFGHFGKVKTDAAAVIVQPIPTPGVGELPPTPVAAEPPPDIKVNGVMKMGSSYVVFIGASQYRTGDDVLGARITNISQNEVTFSWKGKTFSKPTR